MINQDQPFETREHDLTGYASLDLYNKETFNSFAAKLADYNPDRFEPVVLKVYMQDHDIIATLYALDKSEQEKNNYPPDKLPVKKFKLKMNWPELLNHIKSFDIVVSDHAYNIRDIMVTNK